MPLTVVTDVAVKQAGKFKGRPVHIDIALRDLCRGRTFYTFPVCAPDRFKYSLSTQLVFCRVKAVYHPALFAPVDDQSPFADHAGSFFLKYLHQHRR